MSNKGKKNMLLNLSRVPKNALLRLTMGLDPHLTPIDRMKLRLQEKESAILFPPKRMMIEKSNRCIRQPFSQMTKKQKINSYQN